MSVSNTSLKAFNKLIETKKLSKRRKEVAEALFKLDISATSSMLEAWCSTQEEFFHLRRCTIVGRLNELEKMNVVRVVKTEKCEVTGSTAKYYTVVENL